MAQYQPVSADTEAVSREIVDSAITVHRELGPGLLESVYGRCLQHELITRVLRAPREVPVPVACGGIILESGLKLDLLVNDLVVVELKAVEQLIPLYDAQLLTYLKLTKKQLGLLINFNVPRLKDGIKRLIRTPSLPS